MDNEKQALIERVLKIKALADKGFHGEKEVATKMVEQLMQKYDISEEELGLDVTIEMRWIRYSTKYPYAKRLLSQVIYSVMGDGHPVYKPGKRTKLGVECTKEQAIEIEAKFNFYASALRMDIDSFFHAFLSKNNIYPPEELVDPSLHDDSEWDPEKLAKIIEMKGALDKHHFHKQLE